MNRFLRGSRWWRGIAVSAMAASLFGAWLAVSHGDVREDSACAEESGLRPAQGGTTLRPGADFTSPQHCYLCHWTRSLRTIAQAAIRVIAVVAPRDLIPNEPISFVNACAPILVPARSPPASTLSKPIHLG